MALTKVTYVDGETVIGAANLNAIQDEIIHNADDISDLDTNKVDKIEGKGLSTNDYTDAEKNKLAGIQTNANVANVAYDTTNKKITKTINGSTSDVVSAATLKTDMAINAGDVAYNESTTYANGTIGKAQSDLKSAISLNEITFTDDANIVTSSSPVNLTPNPHANWRYAIVNCQAGDRFILNAVGGSDPRAYTFIDASNNVISGYRAAAGATITNFGVVAPTNAAKLIINDKKSGSVCFKTNDAIDTLLFGEVDNIKSNYFTYIKRLTSSDDANDVTQCGLYNAETNNVPAHWPFQSTAARMLVVKSFSTSNVDFIWQIVIGGTNNTFWYRSKHSAWSEWEKVVKPSEIFSNNVTYYGAKGDGTTDDTTAIKSALTACSGKSCYLPSGTYIISESIEIPSGTKLYGDGLTTIIKLKAGKDNYDLTEIFWHTYHEIDEYIAPMVYSDDTSSDITVRDLCIIGDTTEFKDQRQCGLMMQGTNITLDNILVHDINYFPDTYYPTSARVHRAPGYGFFIFSTEKVNISNCKIYNCGYENLGIDSSEGVTIVNCYFGLANQTAFQLHRSVQFVTVTNCVFKNPPTSATGGAVGGAQITMHGEPGKTVERVTIDNCILRGWIEMVNCSENLITISNCDIRGSAGTFKQSDLDSTGLYRQEIILTGNRITCTKQNEAAINMICDKALIVGNIIDAPTTAIIINGNDSLVQNNLFVDSDTVTINTHS